VKIEYDPDRDLLYLWLGKPGTKAAKTNVVAPDVHADFDRNDKVIGVLRKTSARTSPPESMAFDRYRGLLPIAVLSSRASIRMFPIWSSISARRHGTSMTSSTARPQEGSGARAPEAGVPRKLEASDGQPCRQLACHVHPPSHLGGPADRASRPKDGTARPPGGAQTLGRGHAYSDNGHRPNHFPESLILDPAYLSALAEHHGPEHARELAMADTHLIVYPDMKMAQDVRRLRCPGYAA